jgi:hypothetical protein
VDQVEVWGHVGHSDHFNQASDRIHDT